MLSSLEIAEVSCVLKLLGDKTRLSVVSVLNQRECCVCELVDAFEMSQPSISQHLRKLKEVGIVKEDKRGQWVYYSLNRESKFYPLISDFLKRLPVQTDFRNKLIKSNLSKQHCH